MEAPRAAFVDYGVPGRWDQTGLTGFPGLTKTGFAPNPQNPVNPVQFYRDPKIGGRRPPLQKTAHDSPALRAKERSKGDGAAEPGGGLWDRD